MIFAHSREGVLKIGPDALAMMRRYEQHAPDALEAGGILLGRYLRNGHDLVVDVVTEPMPGDERSRFGFFRAAESTSEGVGSGSACVCQSPRRTHVPPLCSQASIVARAWDLDNWRKMLGEAEPGEARFFVIVGQRTIRVWEGDTRTGEIRPCASRAP